MIQHSNLENFQSEKHVIDAGANKLKILLLAEGLTLDPEETIPIFIKP